MSETPDKGKGDPTKLERSLSSKLPKKRIIRKTQGSSTTPSSSSPSSPSGSKTSVSGGGGGDAGSPKPSGVSFSFTPSPSPLSEQSLDELSPHTAATAAAAASSPKAKPKPNDMPTISLELPTLSKDKDKKKTKKKKKKEGEESDTTTTTKKKKKVDSLAPSPRNSSSSSRNSPRKKSPRSSPRSSPREKRDTSTEKKKKPDKKIILDGDKDIVKLILCQSVVRRRLAMQQYIRMKKMVMKRGMVVKELLSTEQTYVDNLHLLVTIFMKPLREHTEKSSSSSSWIHMINDTVMKTVFSDVEVILGYNSMMLRTLETRIAPEKFSPTRTLLADVFLLMADFLKTYTQYLNHYHKAESVFRKLKDQKEFASFMQGLQAKQPLAVRKKTLRDYLILPVQRIPRYNLLLRDLLKVTWDYHPDYSPLVLAADKIQEVARYVEAFQEECHNLDKVTAVSKMLQTPHPRLEGKFKVVVPWRRFVREDDIIQLSGVNMVSMHAFLFNDILIFTKAKKQNFVMQKVLPLALIVKAEEIACDDKKVISFELPGEESWLIMAGPLQTAWMADVQKHADQARDKYISRTGKGERSPSVGTSPGSSTGSAIVATPLTPPTSPIRESKILSRSRSRYLPWGDKNQNATSESKEAYIDEIIMFISDHKDKKLEKKKKVSTINHSKSQGSLFKWLVNNNVEESREEGTGGESSSHASTLPPLRQNSTCNIPSSLSSSCSPRDLETDTDVSFDLVTPKHESGNPSPSLSPCASPLSSSASILPTDLRSQASQATKSPSMTNVLTGQKPKFFDSLKKSKPHKGQKHSKISVKSEEEAS